MSVVAVSVEFVPIGSTPLQMLVAVVVLSLIAGAVITLAVQLAGRVVDRRWPATQTLSPMEMLWAEAGGHVQRTFKGMDLGLSRDLSRNLVERRLKAGAFLFQEGDPASHFYILTKGKAEALKGGETLREYGPGDSFGEVAILERTARTAGIRAVTDCVVLELGADDFVASAALSAADEVDFAKVVEGYLAADLERAAAPPAAPRPTAARAPAPAATAPPAPPAAAPEPADAPTPPTTGTTVAPGAAADAAPGRSWQPTHLVPAGGLPGWDDARRSGPPVRKLPARTELVVVERTGRTARVVTEEGWQGWVDGRLLIPRRG